ncbi:MAG: hypothetical protein Q7R90_01030, partial [bacterium]|nr:hypothetical protein [bacterium]
FVYAVSVPGVRRALFRGAADDTAGRNASSVGRSGYPAVPRGGAPDGCGAGGWREMPAAVRR